jgi:hypothetical protein
MEAIADSLRSSAHNLLILKTNILPKRRRRLARRRPAESIRQPMFSSPAEEGGPYHVRLLMAFLAVISTVLDDTLYLSG